MTTKDEKTEGIIYFDELDSQDLFGLNKGEDNDLTGKIEIKDPDKPEDTNVSEKQEEDDILLSGTNPGREKQPGEEKPIVNPIQDVLKTRLKNIGISTVLKDNESGEEEEVSIDDVDIDEDTFEGLISAYIEKQKEEVQKDKVSVEGASELAKKLLEIDKKGGNVTAILEEKLKVLDPIESIDISTSEGQEKAIAFFLHQTGKDQEDIEARIKLYREKGILAEKAEEFQGEIRKAFDKFVEQEKERAIEAKTKTEEALKEYRKNLTEKIGARFELNDSAKKKLVDFAAKPTNENKFLLDEKLREIRMNPEEAAELALFVLDKEEYIKQVTNKKVTDEKIKTAIRLGEVKKARDNRAGVDDLITSGKQGGGFIVPLE